MSQNCSIYTLLTLLVDNFHLDIQSTRCNFSFSTAGSAEEFNYTNMGGNTVIEGVNDKDNMMETQKTFTMLGI